MQSHFHHARLPITGNTTLARTVIDVCKRRGIEGGFGVPSGGAPMPRWPRLRRLWVTMLGWFPDGAAQGLAERLRESEDRMNLAADAAHFGIWIWDLRLNSIWLSDHFRELFGLHGTGDVSFKMFLNCVHPEDRAATQNAMLQAICEKSSYHAAYRFLLPDGTARYVEASGRMERGPRRKPLRMLGICIDVSERRHAEEAARELSGRFITAQEDERRRIARDLHDDLNQRLALLSVEMELFGRTSARRQGQSDHRLQELVAHVREISSEIHNLSHKLHPAKLDQLGLLAAVRAFCRESSERWGIRVEFVHDHVPTDLPPDIALCLYRVLQESLQNVVRHSGAQKAQAELKMKARTIQLALTDSGKGFDVAHARQNGGLGLVSMEERVRLVRGSFAMHSKPGEGTRVQVTIPLP
jgi:PAS domain S-box-containing protein